MSNTDINLEDLPEPNVVEEVDYEQLLLDRKNRLIQLNPKYEAVMELESDPLTTDLEVGAFREYILRHRINKAAQASLLAKAMGTDLDHLGYFYGVTRGPSETDADYRIRIRVRILGSSTAGSAANYRSQAEKVEPVGIRDIAIDSPEGGKVRVSILVQSGYCFTRKSMIKDLGEFQCKDFCKHKEEIGDREDNACPEFTYLSDELIKKVRAHVTSDDVRMLTDTVSVVPSEKVIIDVNAEIYLQPGIPDVIFNEIVLGFKDAWKKEGKLGWDLTPSWIIGQLQRDGVHHVNLIEPTETTLITPNQSAFPGNITITLKSERKF
jgi:phage-related baseplate assembly protein